MQKSSASISSLIAMALVIGLAVCGSIGCQAVNAANADILGFEPQWKQTIVEKHELAIDTSAIITDTMIIFSGKEKVRIAYAVRDGQDLRHIEVDGVRHSSFKEILEPRFSTGGTNFVYIGKNDSGLYVVEENRSSDAYEELWGNRYAFGPSGEIYYLGRKGSQWTAVVGPFRHLAHNAVLDLKKLSCECMDRKILFSLSGKHHVLVAQDQPGQFVETDTNMGSPYGPYTKVLTETISFHPGADYFGYIAYEDGRGYMAHIRSLQNGYEPEIKSAYYDYVPPQSEIVFKKNGSPYAFVAMRSGKWFVVANGQEQKKYDWITGFKPLETGDGFVYFGYLAGKLYQVTHTFD